jgi:hypothetical protein
LPSASMTPQPVKRRPGSMPSSRAIAESRPRRFVARVYDGDAQSTILEREFAPDAPYGVRITVVELGGGAGAGVTTVVEARGGAAVVSEWTQPASPIDTSESRITLRMELSVCGRFAKLPGHSLRGYAHRGDGCDE